MDSAVVIIFKEIILELLYAPIWWYTRGAVRATERFYERLKEGDAYLGWSVWLKNVFTPMYAQRDMAGRLISIVVRVVQIIVRTIFIVGWLLADFLMLVAYFILPIVTFFEIIYQWRLVKF